MNKYSQGQQFPRAKRNASDDELKRLYITASLNRENENKADTQQIYSDSRTLVTQ